MFVKICILMVAIPLSTAASFPNDACSSYFTYVTEYGDTFGQVHVPYENVPVAELEVEVLFAQHVPSNQVGIDMIQAGHKIRSHGLLYKVTFPNQLVIPRVIQITLNGRILCQGLPLGSDPYDPNSLAVTVKHRTRFFGQIQGSFRKLGSPSDEVEVLDKQQLK